MKLKKLAKEAIKSEGIWIYPREGQKLLDFIRDENDLEKRYVALLNENNKKSASSTDVSEDIATCSCKGCRDYRAAE